jgi:signal transduction histidine kinase
MPRYLVRQGNTGRGWVVWDRVKRGPAVVDGRELARLSREDAYAAIALLNGPSFDNKKVPMPSAWQVHYCGIIVDCRDEQDAKSLARELVRKGFRVSAGTIEGAIAARRVEPDQMEDWLLSETMLLSERQVSELREQFIAVLGQDLQNPLSSIAAGARMITKASKKETFEIAALMQTSIHRMSLLIDNVRDFARGRLGGEITLQRNANEPVDQILNQVVAELRSSYMERRIETSFDLTETVNCDGQRIGQLFSNLLGNAIMHGSPDQPVVVQATTQCGVFELSVANSGDPIPPAAMKQLFQPFYRGNVKHSLQGLGLGLYIASQIARAHGGTLDVNSSANETRFTFRMPTSP